MPLSAVSPLSLFVVPPVQATNVSARTAAAVDRRTEPIVVPQWGQVESAARTWHAQDGHGCIVYLVRTIAHRSASLLRKNVWRRSASPSVSAGHRPLHTASARQSAS